MEALHAAARQFQTIEPTVQRANPERAGVVLAHAEDVWIGKRRRAIARSVTDERLVLRVVAAQSVVAAHPELPLRIHIERAHRIARERTRIAASMPKVTRTSGARIEQIQSAVA